MIDPGDLDFMLFTGFYGEASPDCSAGYPNADLPEGCAIDAARPGDGGVAFDAGPYECVLTP